MAEVKLALRELAAGCAADAFESLQMFGGGIVCGLRLHQRSLGGVEIAAGDGALLKELGAAFDDALVEAEVGLGLGEIELRGLRGLGHLDAGRLLVGRLRCGVAALIVECGALQVAVFEGDEQFAGADVRSSLHVELLYGSADFWRESGLGERGENGVALDVLGDGGDLGLGCLNGDDDLRGGLVLLAAGEREAAEECRGRVLQDAARRRALVRTITADGSKHHRSKPSRECLKIGQRELIAHDAVGASDLCG